MNEHTKNDRRFWLGIIFISMGAIWLLDNLNIFHFSFPRYIFSWKTLLILIGLFLIARKEKVESGLTLIVVGGIFLLRDLGIWNFHSIRQIIWPAVIIGIGLALLYRQRQSTQSQVIDSNDVDYIDDFAVLGGKELTVTSQTFKGGKITAIMGGSQIDLRQASLAEGNNRMDIFAVFGGTTIIVPPDWTIRVEVFPLMGGFKDNRYSPLAVIPNPEKVLIISGFVLFGGGDVKLNK